MTVAAWSGALAPWKTELEALKARLGTVLPRAELRSTAGAFLDGLLSGVSRKTGWLMAEQAGFDRPYRMQSLLGRSRWSADALRDVVRGYALEALSDPDGVLAVEEIVFRKRGAASVGVTRQPTGTAGRIQNCQIGVFLVYASRHGHALIDRRLYLPTAWVEDAARRTRAAVPPEIAFETRAEIAGSMIAGALDAGTPCAWVLADAPCCGGDVLQDMLEARLQRYVMAVPSGLAWRMLKDKDLLASGTVRPADAVASEAWVAHPAGDGAGGLRLYDWARIAMPSVCPPGHAHWLLIRRCRRDPAACTCYLVFAPAGTSLGEVAGAAGLRWTSETCIRHAQDDLGLDHCEARSWHGWHRHMTLCMAAAAFLARLVARVRVAAGVPEACDKTAGMPT